MKFLAQTLMAYIGAHLLVPALAQEAEKQPPLFRPDISAMELKPEENYYNLSMMGQKIGWMSEQFYRGKFEGQDAYIIKLQFVQELLNDGKALRMSNIDTTYFSTKAPYGLLASSSISEQEAFRSSTWIRQVEAGSEEFVAVIKGGGAEREKELGKLDFNLGDGYAVDVWCRSEPETGDKIRVLELDMTELAVRPALNTIKRVFPAQGDGAVDVLGHAAKYELEYVDMVSEVKVVFLTDAIGDVLKGAINGVIDVVLTTEEDAKKLKAGIDLFDSSLIKIDQALGDPTAIREMVIEISGEGAKVISDSAFQKKEVQQDGTAILKIGREHGVKMEVTDEARAEALKETTIYPTKDPEVMKLVERAMGKATRPKARIKRLVDFVDRFIIDDYANEPLSVNDIIETRRGDCSEHAQLFVTMARAAGIPAREISGFIYGEGADFSFGGHAWCEVEVDGYWHPVDPTWGETVINATHVRVSGDKLSSDEMGLFFGKLKFRVLSTTDKKGKVRNFED